MRTHVKRAAPKRSQFDVPARGGAAAARPIRGRGLIKADIVRFDPRLLLEPPIGATLRKLAAPNVLVMLVQAPVGLIREHA